MQRGTSGPRFSQRYRWKIDEASGCTADLPDGEILQDERWASAKGIVMRMQATHLMMAALSLAGLSAPGWADTLATDVGRTEYMSNCASCHGVGGKGDGPVAQGLTKKPSDLTTLARRSGGALPAQLVWEMIDGRASVDIFAHGSRDMPVWGAEYRAMALLQSDPAIAARPEWYVRGRIVSLIDYLNRIQVK
jgi:mono/diheme cytochrome c family protein